MKIEFSSLAGFLIATPHGDLVSYHAEEFQTRLIQRLQSSHNCHLLVNLRFIDRLDVYGCDALVAVARLVRRHQGGFLRLYNGRRELFDVLANVPDNSLCERYGTLTQAQTGETQPQQKNELLQALGLDFCDCSINCQRVLRETDVTVETCHTITFDAVTRTDTIYYANVMVWWCTAGRIRVHLSNGHSDISAGEAVVIYGATHVAHEALESGSELKGIGFLGSMDEDVFNHLGFFNGLITRSAFPARLFDQLRTIIALADYDISARRELLLQSIWPVLLGLLDEARANGDPVFFDAIRILNRNFLKRITRLDPTYHELQTSRNNLAAIFRRNQFPTPSSYVIDLQLRKARKLLRINDYSIADVAYRCGFGDAMPFATFFKRHTGLCPNEVRRGRTVSRSLQSVSDGKTRVT